MVLVVGLIRGRRLAGRDDPLPLTGEQFSEEFFLSLTPKGHRTDSSGRRIIFSVAFTPTVGLPFFGVSAHSPDGGNRRYQTDNRQGCSDCSSLISSESIRQQEGDPRSKH